MSIMFFAIFMTLFLTLVIKGTETLLSVHYSGKRMKAISDKATDEVNAESDYICSESFTHQFEQKLVANHIIRTDEMTMCKNDKCKDCLVIRNAALRRDIEIGNQQRKELEEKRKALARKTFFEAQEYQKNQNKPIEHMVVVWICDTCGRHLTRKRKRCNVCIAKHGNPT